MNTYGNTPVATAASVNGKIYVQQENGSKRILKAGDKIYEGDIIVSESGAKAVLRAENGTEKTIEGNQSVQLSAVHFSNAAQPDLFEEQPEQHDKPSPRQIDSLHDQHHGFIRVSRIDETLGEMPYRFVSVKGNYDPSADGRTAEYDAFVDGRATHDPRIAMDPLAIEYVEREEVVRQYTEYAEDEKSNTRPSIGIPENQIVDEDDLDNSQSEGSDPEKETVVVSGSLDVIPAGEPLDTVFNSTSSLPVLFSQGAPVQYEIINDGHTIRAYTDDGRTVFTVVINNPSDSNGEQSYTFTLDDQLDHPDGQGENLLDIPFSFTVQDYNGDAVNGIFTVTVVDDVPVQTSTVVSGQVHEDLTRYADLARVAVNDKRSRRHADGGSGQ